jgi:hypothetical protein
MKVAMPTTVKSASVNFRTTLDETWSAEKGKRKEEKETRPSPSEMNE